MKSFCSTLNMTVQTPALGATLYELGEGPKACASGYETAGTRPAAFQAARTSANGAQPSPYPFDGATPSVAGPSGGLRLFLPPRGWPPHKSDTRGRRPATPEAVCEKDGRTCQHRHSASDRPVNSQRCLSDRRRQRARSWCGELRRLRDRLALRHDHRFAHREIASKCSKSEP